MLECVRLSEHLKFHCGMNIVSVSVCRRYFVCNFKGLLWNSIKIYLTHISWNMWYIKYVLLNCLRHHWFRSRITCINDHLVTVSLNLRNEIVIFPRFESYYDLIRVTFCYFPAWFQYPWRSWLRHLCITGKSADFVYPAHSKLYR